MDANPTIYYPGPIALPSDRAWFDPALIGRSLYVQKTDIIVPMAGVVAVAIANPYRWAVGLCLAPGSGTGASAAPWSDLFSGGLIVLALDRLDWYYLPKFGPLATGPWYATGGAGSVVRVTEIIRRGKG